MSWDTSLDITKSQFLTDRMAGDTHFAFFRKLARWSHEADDPSRAGILHRGVGTACPPLTCSNVWSHFWLTQLGRVGATGIRGWRLGMLSMLQGAGWPHHQSYRVQSVRSAEGREAGPEQRGRVIPSAHLY